MYLLSYIYNLLGDRIVENDSKNLITGHKLLENASQSLLNLNADCIR